MKRKGLLQEFATAFPFLLEIPSQWLNQIDSSEFFLPESLMLREIQDLSDSLQSNVIIYQAKENKKPAAGKIFLCTLLTPASLTQAQLALLQRTELKYKNLDVSLVAYKRPIELSPALKVL